jgi:hypothetical protein
MDERTQGIEFGDLADDLESHDYPADAAELRDAYGDRTLEIPNGETTFGDALLVDDQTFESADEVEQAVLNGIGSEAVGNEGYSDRGQELPDAEDTEQTE